MEYMTEKIPLKFCDTLNEFTTMATFMALQKNSLTAGFTFDLSGRRATY